VQAISGGGMDTSWLTIVSFTVTGFPVTEEQLRDVAQHSGVLQIDDDYIEAEFRAKCARIIPMPVEHHVEPAECAEAYKYLKRRYSQAV